jgi:BirA family transcriptional regulator, biotin operon repressor / biotin---[acetyl-CoA-carboxylase] ligase
MLGRPRLHLRETTSTNDRARELAARGAPHGTIVTAGVQTAGRRRQGRTWTAPPGSALLVSVVLRAAPSLLPLRAGLAVADVAGPAARVKWPNDVLVDGRNVAGILAEARPAEHWTVLGIGVNAALEVDDLPPELRATAASLGRAPEPVLGELLTTLERWIEASPGEVLDALRARDALLDHPVRWSDGDGIGAGIDGEGALLVRRNDGSTVRLDAGEVHLG